MGGHREVVVRVSERLEVEKDNNVSSSIKNIRKEKVIEGLLRLSAVSVPSIRARMRLRGYG